MEGHAGDVADGNSTAERPIHCAVDLDLLDKDRGIYRRALQRYPDRDAERGVGRDRGRRRPAVGLLDEGAEDVERGEARGEDIDIEGADISRPVAAWASPERFELREALAGAPRRATETCPPCPRWLCRLTWILGTDWQLPRAPPCCWHSRVPSIRLLCSEDICDQQGLQCPDSDT